jgi:uncharacterized protein with PIN domain
MNHIDLFTGIGGFSYAARMVWGDEHNILHFVEYDRYCQELLKIRFKGVPIHGDITDFDVDVLVDGVYSRLTESEKGVIDTRARMKKYDEAVNMYNAGLSIQDVADFYGITRQAMWMVLKRRGCSFRGNKKYGEENHFHRGTQASDTAQNVLEKAVLKGVVQRKGVCEKCGDAGEFKDGRTAIQAHHPDYNKPLDVMWLCQKCHHDWHKHNKAIPRKEVMPDEVSRATNVDLLTGGFP